MELTKPAEPVVTESVHSLHIRCGYANIDAEVGPPDTHQLTLTIIDGEIQPVATVEKL